MQIKKLSYSRAPWRLITSDGREVYSPHAMDHASLGETVVNAPICGDTKTECIDNALTLLEALMSRRA